MNIKETAIVLFKLLLLGVTCALVSTKLYAQSCTSCPVNWYSCDAGNKCCIGGGCPQWACGNCPVEGGWVYIGTGVSQCSGFIPGTNTGVSYTCNGGCSACGASAPSGPWEKPILGYVYEDTNGNDAYNGTDRHFGRTGFDYTWCSGTYGNLVQSSIIAVNGGGTWGCGTQPDAQPDTNQGAYKVDGFWTDRQYNITLSMPSGYSCSAVKWSWHTCGDSACNIGNRIEYGVGCQIAGHSIGKYRNTVIWQLGASAPVTVSGTLYKTTDTASCNNTGAIALPGLTASMYNGAALVGANAAVNATTSVYSMTRDSDEVFNSICINGNLNAGANSYALDCVRASVPGSPAVTYSCTKGSGACAVNCTPNTVLTNKRNVTINMGFKQISNDSWFVVQDGDFYSNSVLAEVGATPAAGFTNKLINVWAAGSAGGFGFAGAGIDTQTAGTGVSALGGYAKNLNSINGHTFEDGWLNKFSFTPPTTAIATVPAGNAFVDGGVYRFTVAQMNTIIQSGAFTLSAPASTPGVAIVYVTGAGTISFNNTFWSSDAYHTMLIVTTAPVEISENLSYSPISTYSSATASQIRVSILSSSDITVKSKYNASTSTYDLPFIIRGSLLSRSGVKLNRNLGATNNASYPAQLLRAWTQLGRQIRKYEINFGGATSGYTGLTTNDVQFVYSK